MFSVVRLGSASWGLAVEGGSSARLFRAGSSRLTARLPKMLYKFENCNVLSFRGCFSFRFFNVCNCILLTLIFIMSQFFALLKVPNTKTNEMRRYCNIAGCQVSYQREVSKTTLKRHAMSHSAQPSIVDVVAITNNASLPEQMAKTFALLNWALHHSVQVYTLKVINYLLSLMLITNCLPVFIVL